jgi:quercetin dioxygenase-like cupin family protein
MQVISAAGTFSPATDGATTHWVEQLRVPDLSVGTYSIARGGVDDQVPHTEDEIYVVTAGRARLQAGGGSAEVSPGSVIFVPAAEVHRFTDITEDFAAIVVFGPAEESRAGRGS